MQSRSLSIHCSRVAGVEGVQSVLEAIFFAGSSTYFGEYERKSDGKIRDFGTPRDAERAFRELRKRSKEVSRYGAGGLRTAVRWQLQYAMGVRERDTIFIEEDELRRHEKRRRRLTSPQTRSRRSRPQVLPGGIEPPASRL